MQCLRIMCNCMYAFESNIQPDIIFLRRLRAPARYIASVWVKA